MEKIEEKKINKDERINGTESSNVILYSDDYDGLDNSEFNTKVCMLTFWTGYLYFPGGELQDKSVTLEDNIVNYVKKLLDFDISHYKDNLVHISSRYIAEDHTVHTYALQIKKMEMATLQMKNITFDNNGEPDEQSQILLDTCGINKFNVSRSTLDFVMKSNFGPGVKEDFDKFISQYITKKMIKEQDFINQVKNKRELEVIAQKVSENTGDIYNDLKELLKEKGLMFLLDENDERSKSIMDENGKYKDEELKKLFDTDIMSDIFQGKKKENTVVKNTSFDFKQKAW